MVIICMIGRTVFVVVVVGEKGSGLGDEMDWGIGVLQKEKDK